MNLRRKNCATAGIDFNDIVGMSSAKDVLKEIVIFPLQVPELFTDLLEPCKGVLLFGPPGTGGPSYNQI